MIEFSLIAFLKGNVTISNLVGSKIYPDVIPNGSTAYPAVVLQTISDVPGYSMAGEIGLTYVRIQVSCWARTRLAARQLDDTIRQVLSGYAGLAASDTIQSSFAQTRRDVIEPDPENEAARLFGCQRDYLIGFTELNP
jgi:hypothetical protein